MNQTIRRLNIEDELRCIEYLEISGKGVKYRLLKDYSVQTLIRPSETIYLGYITLHMDGLLIIRAGYCWNGSNFCLDTLSTQRASLIHDAMCDIYATGKLSKETIKLFNDLYKKASKEDGAWEISCTVRRFGLKKGWQGFFN